MRAHRVIRPRPGTISPRNLPENDAKRPDITGLGEYFPVQALNSHPFDGELECFSQLVVVLVLIQGTCLKRQECVSSTVPFHTSTVRSSSESHMAAYQTKISYFCQVFIMKKHISSGEVHVDQLIRGQKLHAGANLLSHFHLSVVRHIDALLLTGLQNGPQITILHAVQTAISHRAFIRFDPDSTPWKKSPSPQKKVVPSCTR